MSFGYNYDQFLEDLRGGSVTDAYAINYENNGTPQIMLFHGYEGALKFYNSSDIQHKKVSYGYQVITKDNHFFSEYLKISEKDFYHLLDPIILLNLRNSLSKRLADRIFGR